VMPAASRIFLLMSPGYFSARASARALFPNWTTSLSTPRGPYRAVCPVPG
jgi:hypothetical protein